VVMSEPILHAHMVIRVTLGDAAPRPGDAYAPIPTPVGVAEFDAPMQLDTLFTNVTGPGVARFESIAFGDESPIPWRDDLVAYGVAAIVRPPLPRARHAGPCTRITARFAYSGLVLSGWPYGAEFEFVLHFVAHPHVER
jgi:hypothetical protein